MKPSVSRFCTRLFLFALAALAAAPASATVFVRVSDADLARQAAAVAEVRVRSVDPSPGAPQPLTEYVLEVERLVAGYLPGTTIAVHVPGGVLADGSELFLFGAPRFVVDERALVFLVPRADGAYGLLHFLQGVFRLSEHRGRTVAWRDFAGATEVELAGRAPLEPERPRDLARFRIWLDESTRGGEPAADYRLDLDVAELAAARGGDKFTLIHSSQNGLPFRWREFDQNRSVVFRSHQGGQPGLPNAVAEFRAALSTWGARAGSTVRLSYGGTTAANGGLSRFDNVNGLLFDDPNGHFSTAFSCSSGGSIAAAGPWSNGSTHLYRGARYNNVVGGDIVTNKGISCWIGSNRRAQEVFAHEIGHTLGLGHSCGDRSSGPCNTSAKNQALMRAQAHGDGRGASLSSDDRAGIGALYGSAGSPPAGPSDLEATVSAAGAVELTWRDRANDETGFAIERRVPGGEFERIANLGANATSFEDVEVGPGLTYTYRVRARNAAGSSAWSNQASVTLPGEPLPCDPGPNTLCLNRGRFVVEVEWLDFNDIRGPSSVVPVESDDSGLLWFFERDNWEMLVKVLDGCGFNQHFWVFAAATTDVGYTLSVTDTLTGLERRYDNPLGVASAALTDTEAFATCSVGAAGTPAPVSRPAATSAAATATVDKACGGTLCLNRERFRIEVDWRDFEGGRGRASAVPVESDDSGLLWFFEPDNWEMLVKVLDGCAFNGHYWVFSAATTDIQYTLRVTDTESGEVKSYRNPLGNAAAALTDTFAFDACP